MENKNLPLERCDIDLVIHGLELIIDDKNLTEGQKKFLTYLKLRLEGEE